MNNKQRETLKRFESAQRKMLKYVYTMKNGGQALEAEYASSYKKLVAMGIKPKIRGKYSYNG